MKLNMKDFIADLIASKTKKPAPVLAFPAAPLMGITVKELATSADLLTKAMRLVAERATASVAFGFMDLSVEAEAFGAEIAFPDDGVPTVINKLISSEEDLKMLKTPKIGDGRTGEYLVSVAKAAEVITDRPIFGNVIGPYSLAGRLTDVTEIMLLCFDNPDFAHALLERTTDFLTRYSLAYKEAGANGVVIAEPLPGVLSPDLSAEFSGPYVKRIVDAVQDDSFAVCYHNCGNNVPLMTKSISETGAAMFHFGDAIDIGQILPKMPPDSVVMGNINPVGQFTHGTPEGVRAETLSLLEKCGGYDNFLISSGCDIPFSAPWKNIDAFFAACDEFYKKKAK